MEIIKTSTHVLCLSSPFKSHRILQDSMSEQVDQTLLLMCSVLLEHRRWKRCWTSPAQMTTKFHWSPGESALLRAPFWPWLGVNGSWLCQSFPPPPGPSLPPTFPICCHWHTHKHAKSLIQLKILLGRKRSRDNAGQQELPAIRLA